MKGLFIIIILIASRFVYWMHSEISRENRKFEAQIRWGDNPDDPNILYSYIDYCREMTAIGDEQFSTIVFSHLADLLLKTICDPCLPYQRRSLCLDNICQPLYALSNLAENEN